MGGLIKWTVILSLAGGFTAWVHAMMDKLTSDQIGMMMMAIIILVPLCAVLALMVLKSDADRRMDHVERMEYEKTSRKRGRNHEPPVVIIVGSQQPQLPATVHNHISVPPAQIAVKNAYLPDGTHGQMIEANGKQAAQVTMRQSLPTPRQERRFKIVGEREEFIDENGRLIGGR